MDNEKIGFYGLTPASRTDNEFQHPANKVGVWAYRSRWPLNYGETVSAYASADSDAFSRWGLWGIVLISCAIFILRYLIKLFIVDSKLSKAIYLSIVTLIGYTLPVGSIFASIIAQGVDGLIKTRKNGRVERAFHFYPSSDNKKLVA